MIASGRQRAGYLAYLAQELKLDAATPGKAAAERLVQNANLIFDTVEAWAIHEGTTIEQCLQEVWKHDKDAGKRYLERHKKATGRKTRGD